MKKILLPLLLAFVSLTSNAQQVFFQESFEDTLGWTISHLFDDGVEDYVLNDSVAVINSRSNGPDFTIVGADSTHVIAFEDIDSGDPGSTTANGEVELNIDSIVISNRVNLSIHMAAAANPTSNNYDKAKNWFGSNGNGDTVSVEVKIDGGNWTKVMYFCADSGRNAGNVSNTGPLYFDKNLNYDGGDGTDELALNDTLTDFSANINGTGNYLSIRIKVRVESGDEEFVMDNIRLAENCDQPTNLAANNIDTTSAQLSWTTGGASNAVIQYGATGFTLGQGTMISVTSSPYSLGSLVPATTYQFYVKDSCSATSTSAWAGPFSFTTQSNTCNAPTGLGNAMMSDTSVTIGWTTGGATAWNVQYGAAGFSLGSGTMLSNLSSTMLVINGLMPGTAYDVYVQDTCGGGLGASTWTGPLSFTTYDNPSIVSARVLNGTTIELVFSDSMDISTTTDPSNYGGIPGLNIISLNNTFDTVTLNYTTPLVDGIISSIQVFDNILSLRQIKLDTNYNFDFLWNASTPDVVITEIMYNDLSDNDSLEFIELFNNGMGVASLGGMSFDQGVDYTFPAGTTLNPGSYLLVAANAAAVNSIFGVSGTMEWTGGNLSNSGEDISIVNSLDSVIDYVDYDDRAPWDFRPDGFGYSLVLCDPNEDNSLVSSWWRETNRVAGHYTSPGAMNSCWPTNYNPPYRTIAEMKPVDADGVLDSLNQSCYFEGTVFTPDFDGNAGYSFFIYDTTGGVNIFEFADEPNNYQVKVGDKIRAYGIMIQFNGLAELRVDSIIRIDSNMVLKEPADVSMLDESTEGEFIRLRDVFMADPSDWRSSGSFNFEVVTQAGDTLAVRVDSDTDVTGTWSSAPLGNFDLTGVGQQFDGSSPYTSGYQIFPRFATDIDTSSCPAPSALALDNVDSTSATVSWTGASLADLQFGLAGFNLGSGNMMDSVASPYTIMNLDDTTNYEFYVRQVCASKSSVWSGPFAFTTLASPTAPNSVEVVRSTSDFKVFPNPTNGGVIQFNKVANVRVMDVLGNFLMAKDQTKTLDVSELSSGMYFIIESEGNMVKLILE